jgi:hypothetical protein
MRYSDYRGDVSTMKLLRMSEPDAFQSSFQKMAFSRIDELTVGCLAINARLDPDYYISL